MEISTVQETVTVSGESPVVDTRSTAIVGELQQGSARQDPVGARPVGHPRADARHDDERRQRRRQPVGPADVVQRDGQQHEPAVEHRRRGDQRHRLGQLVADLLRLRLVRGNPDHDRRRDASQQGAGVQVNFITKSGSNKLRGSGRFYDTNQKFESQQRHRRAARSGAAAATRFRTSRTTASSSAARS